MSGVSRPSSTDRRGIQDRRLRDLSPNPLVVPDRSGLSFISLFNSVSSVSYPVPSSRKLGLSPRKFRWSGLIKSRVLEPQEYTS